MSRSRKCSKEAFTGDVKEAWQEAVPESTHLDPQTSVYLQRFSVESNMFLLTDGELRPASLAFNNAIMVHIGISEREEREHGLKETRSEQRLMLILKTDTEK